MHDYARKAIFLVPMFVQMESLVMVMNVSKIDLELFLRLDLMLWALLLDTMVEMVGLEQLFASYCHHSPLLVFDSNRSMNEYKWKKADCHPSFMYINV